MSSLYLEQKNYYSSKLLLFIILCIVFAAWFLQLALHQTWLCPFGFLKWKHGFIISFFISLIPLLFGYRLLKQKNTLPLFHLESLDILIGTALIGLGVLFWWYFSKGSISFPIHTFGDETFHHDRVILMTKDYKTWLTGHAPDFRSEYMMYPALAYAPIAFLSSLFGDATTIADQRTWLVIFYLPIILATYLCARTLIQSKTISTLIALIVITSPLLLTYTTSFYIEIPYVSILLFSFWLFAWGIRASSPEIVTCSIFVASLAPIIRESALATAGTLIFFASLWKILNDKSLISTLKKSFYLLGNITLGLIPFTIYYIAKSKYTNWDKERTSLAFIFQQDYTALFNYSFYYISPLVFVAIGFFIIKTKFIRPYAYLFCAAIFGIIGSLLLQSVFLPGYMPWSRNYLFHYADTIVLIIIFFALIHSQFSKNKNVIFCLLLIGVSSNIFICFKYLQNNVLFHESEIVFDLRPISEYIQKNSSKFENQYIYLYWPKGYPDFPSYYLPKSIKLSKVDFTSPEPGFLPFSTIQKNIPKNAKYFLYYYYVNTSKPSAFNTVQYPQKMKALKPTSEELKNYQIIIKSEDPWSKHTNGVLLLEKK